jgi:hypothetical protein
VHRLRKYFFLLTCPLFVGIDLTSSSRCQENAKKERKKKEEKKLEKRVLYKVIIYPCNIHSKIHMI